MLCNITTEFDLNLGGNDDYYYLCSIGTSETRTVQGVPTYDKFLKSAITFSDTLYSKKQQATLLLGNRETSLILRDEKIRNPIRRVIKIY